MINDNLKGKHLLRTGLHSLRVCRKLAAVKIRIRDFPGGPVVTNPPSNAGDLGSIPGQGTKIPHAAGQLSLCALEPACRNY